MIKLLAFADVKVGHMSKKIFKIPLDGGAYFLHKLHTLQTYYCIEITDLTTYTD